MSKATSIAAAGATLTLLSCEVLFPSVVAGDAGSPDGGAEMPDASAQEGGDSSAHPPDATAEASDAGTDAAPDGPYCVVHASHTHCFDFDSVGNAMSGWDSNNLGNGAAVTLDTMAFVSAPHSMQSSVQNGGPTGNYSVLIENAPLNPTQIVLAADVRLIPPADQTYDSAELLGTHLSGTFGYYGVGVGISQAGPGLSVLWPTSDAGAYMSTTEPFASLEADDAGWSRIEMTVDFGPPLAVTLTFNGQPQWSGPFKGTVAVEGATPPDIAVGVVAVGDGGVLAVDYDNVTIDVK